MAGKNSTGFYWKSDTLSGTVKAFPGKVERALVAAIEFNATKAERYARQNAPWTDRTSNARTVLFTATEHVPFKRHSIIIAHTVSYGIWLEVRHSGRYAIILPTLEVTGRETMKTISTLFSEVIKLR